MYVSLNLSKKKITVKPKLKKNIKCKILSKKKTKSYSGEFYEKEKGIKRTFFQKKKIVQKIVGDFL